MATRKRLLTFNDPAPLRIDKKIAVEIGLLESIVLLQLEFRISTCNNFRDGNYWTYQTLADLKKNDFPWLSISTISRVLTALENAKLLIVGNYNKTPYDRTKWFALNWEEIQKIKGLGVGDDVPISQDAKCDIEADKRISQPAKWDSLYEKSKQRECDSPSPQSGITIPESSPEEIPKESPEYQEPEVLATPSPGEEFDNLTATEREPWMLKAEAHPISQEARGTRSTECWEMIRGIVLKPIARRMYCEANQ